MRFALDTFVPRSLKNDEDFRFLVASEKIYMAMSLACRTVQGQEAKSFVQMSKG